MPQKPCHQNHDLNTLPQQGQSHALCKRAARIRCGKEVYQKQTEIMNKLVSIKSTRGSERSTGYVDEVCFWGIATPVTQERDPTMTPQRSRRSVTLVRLKVRTNSGVEVPIGQNTGCS